MRVNKFNRSINLLSGCAILALAFLCVACAGNDNRSAVKEDVVY